MKTLVIHPKDTTTDFLCEIYKEQNWKVINYEISRVQLKKEIKQHDRITMFSWPKYYGRMDSRTL